MRITGLLALTGIIALSSAFTPATQPGVAPPLGFFDPLGFSKDKSSIEFKKLQEAEVKHGRVAMLGIVGLTVQEAFHPLFQGEVIGSPLYHYQIATGRYPWLAPAVVAAIGAVETLSIVRGWELVPSVRGIADLREDYIPGDLGFDPFGLADEDSMIMMRTKELNNGRLAMIACLLTVLQQYYAGR